MKNRVLVDTDVVIDFLNGVEPYATHVENLVLEHRLVLSSITVFELAGVIGKRRVAAIDRFVDSVTVAETGKEEARTAASLYTSLKERGRLIGNSDLLIAASALTRGMQLYTRNMGHFERIKELSNLILYNQA